MANEEIKNAARFMTDTEMTGWVIAGLMWTAKTVLSENPSTTDYAVRRKLAVFVSKEPDNQNIVRQVQNLISVDIDVCSKATVDLVGQVLFLQKIAEMWTHIAKGEFPA